MIATQPSVLESKIQDLCQAIVADTAVQHAREQAEAFLADDASVNLYREVMNTGNRLDRRHRAGEEISDEEVAAYEELQAQADANEGIRAFNHAQQVLQEVANKVNAYVMKTLEKGRVPSAEEIEAASGGGCCGGGGGGGCGCH